MTKTKWMIIKGGVHSPVNVWRFVDDISVAMQIPYIKYAIQKYGAENVMPVVINDLGGYHTHKPTAPDVVAICELVKTARLQHNLIYAIERCTTIDAVPVRHAMWKEADYGYLVCTVCGCEHNRRNVHGFLTDHNYCPNCGAKMDGGADNG